MAIKAEKLREITAGLRDWPLTADNPFKLKRLRFKLSKDVDFETDYAWWGMVRVTTLSDGSKLYTEMHPSEGGSIPRESRPCEPKNEPGAGACKRPLRGWGRFQREKFSFFSMYDGASETGSETGYAEHETGNQLHEKHRDKEEEEGEGKKEHKDDRVQTSVSVLQVGASLENANETPM